MTEPESHVVRLSAGEAADEAVLTALAAEGWKLETTLDGPDGGTELIFQRVTPD
jgi:hypothetical protein